MSIGKSKNILGKPTFDKISHRMGVLSQLTKKSGNKLGLEAGLGNATVNDWSDKQVEKPTRTVEEFLKHHSISQTWWKTGEGEVFITSEQKPGDNKKNGMTTRETFYTDLIENNEEYSLLPRAVLKDYKIVPDKIIDVIIASNEGEKKALKESMETAKEALIKDYERLITGLENKVQRLEDEKAELRKENEDLRRQIPGKD